MNSPLETEPTKPRSLFEKHAASFQQRMERIFGTYELDQSRLTGFTLHPQAQNPEGLRTILKRIIREEIQELHRASQEIPRVITVVEFPRTTTTPAHGECIESTFVNLAANSKNTPAYFAGVFDPIGAGELAEIEEVQLEEGIYLARCTTEYQDGLYLLPRSLTEAPDA